METGDAIALVALVLSLGLAGIRLWEAFFKRPKLGVKFDWIRNETFPILRFVVYNEGSRKICIREIRFGLRDTPHMEGWMRASVLMRLPVVVDVDEASPAFMIQAGAASENDDASSAR